MCFTKGKISKEEVYPKTGIKAKIAILPDDTEPRFLT
jgi:hypothetical protein